jgi:hypothetical protein
VPIIETDSTTTIDGIEHWASGNVTSESRNKMRLILDLYARSKDREFASMTKRWDIDWFWKIETTGPTHDPLRKQKEFYALNLVDADTEEQPWAYS